MGVKVWISLDQQSGDFYMSDSPLYGGAGPIEITNELFERYMECEREFSTMQGILSMLEYEWKYPDE